MLVFYLASSTSDSQTPENCNSETRGPPLFVPETDLSYHASFSNTPKAPLKREPHTRKKKKEDGVD